MPARRPARDLVERLDPDGKARLMTRAVRLMTVRPGRMLLRALAADALDVENLRSLSRQVHLNMSDLERQERLLCPLGWIVFERSPPDAYRRAADLVEQGRVDEAEKVLSDGWNADRAAALRGPLHQVMRLYELPEDDDLIEGTVAFQRAQEIQEAVGLHLDGRHRGAIMIALAEMDGIAADLSPDGRSLFKRRDGFELVDDRTAVGHPANLEQLRMLLTERCPTTTTRGRLLRHGILHGRELCYATEVNSTKVLVALAALIAFGRALPRGGVGPTACS